MLADRIKIIKQGIIFMSATSKLDLFSATKTLFNMSVPVVGSRVSSAINAFIVMLLIAQLGHAELATSALINSINFSFLVPLWQLFSAVGVLVAQNYGAKQYKEIGTIVRQGFLLSVILGIPTIILLCYIKPILLLFGQEKHLAILTQKFFYSYTWSIIPAFWYICLGQFTLGISKQKLALFFTLLVIPFIIIISDIFMFGRLGFPALGIAGMGYANAIAFTCTDIIILAYIYFKKEFQVYKLFALDEKLFTPYLKQIFIIGWPIALMFAGELMLFSLGTIFVGWLGESSLAAWQISIQINLIVIMFPAGIGQACTILISQEIGKKNYSSIRQLAYAGLLLSTICMIIFGLFYWFTPKYLIGFYLNYKNPANFTTMQIAISLLAASILMNLFDAWRSVMAWALRGLRDTMFPMFVFVVLGSVFSLPIGYVLGFPLHMNAPGVRWGFTIGFGIGAIILLQRLYKFTDRNFLLKRYGKNE